MEQRLHFLARRYNFNLHSRRFLKCTSTTFDTVLSNKQTITSFPYHLVRFVATLSLLLRCVCFERSDTSSSRQTASGGRTPNRHFGIVLAVAYPGIFFRGGGVQQIQLRTEDREDGDLRTVAS